MVSGDAEHQFFLAFADWEEAVEEVVEEGEEVFRILAGEDVFVGAQAMEQVVAAGCGLTFRGARTSRFLRVFAIRSDAGLAGGVLFVPVFHVCTVPFALMLWGGIGECGGHFGQAIENTGEVYFGNV